MRLAASSTMRVVKLRNIGIVQQADLAKRVLHGLARDDDDRHILGRADRTGHAIALLHLTTWWMCCMVTPSR